MKIGCRCGATIYDTGDHLPTKAHLFSDVDWSDVLVAIGDAVEKCGPTPADKEAARMKALAVMRRLESFAWQCANCGRVYVDNAQNALEEFVPATPEVDRRLFTSKS